MNYYQKLADEKKNALTATPEQIRQMNSLISEAESNLRGIKRANFSSLYHKDMMEAVQRMRAIANMIGQLYGEVN